MERISTGIQALDALLGGGIPLGSTVLVAGRPGTGKTIFAHHMMFSSASADSKAIYLTTLAEPQVKVMRFQQEFSFFDKSKFQDAVIYRDLGSILRVHGPAQALIEIDSLLKQYEPTLVCIDTIKTVADMMPSSTEYRGFLLDLSLRLATWGCTALLLGEYSEADIDTRPESAIADGIIYLSGTEEKQKQKRLLRILKMRGGGYPGGENVFRITNHGIEVFPRVNPTVSSQNYADFIEERIPTGISDLDNMMGGGIPRASVTMLSGSAGTGKTLLALHFAYAGLQQGEPAVYVTFEENPHQIAKSCASFGLDIAPYLRNGRLVIEHVSPIELDADEHVYAIQQRVAAIGAKRLVIDSISSFELGMANKIKYTDYIWALTDFFKTQGVTVLLTHELHDAGHLGELTKHGISFVADNVLLLRFLECDLDVVRHICVVKMRGSRHSSTLRELIIDENGLRIRPVGR